MTLKVVSAQFGILKKRIYFNEDDQILIPDKMNTADSILTATVWPLNASSGEPRGVSSV